MKIDKSLEVNFIRTIQKVRSERTTKEEQLIRERNQNIERQFEWTPAVNKKLIVLNEKLLQQEKRVFNQYRLIDKHCKSMVSNNQINDYNINIKISYWNNEHYIQYDESVEGNPFYESMDDFMVFQKNIREYDQEPHNEHHDRAPLPEVNHCYSFHSLYDHNPDLTWFDINNIDEVWIELKVDYQFFTKIDF